MTRASGNIAEGAVTAVTGLVLWLFTGEVEVPVVTLAKVGLVLMCVGGGRLLWGLGRSVRARTRTGREPGQNRPRPTPRSG
ncbi:hypothetical protein SUDANB6_01872 [Streptomyces sp. enrichment culture]|uniref:DUF5708 family protein n=1 Tax=Streptomyces sp. enrichment culture TaxID=1795815 RepID=UPI003F550315